MPSLDAKKSFLAQLIPLLEAGGCHGEALYLREETLGINKDDTSIDVARHDDEGVKLRVYDGVQWRERGVSGWDERALKRAAKLLGATRKEQPIRLELPTQELRGHYTALGKRDPATVPLREKIKSVETTQQSLKALDPSLVNARAYLDELRETTIFVDKTRSLSQVISGCTLILVAFVKSADGDLRYHYQTFFSHGWQHVPQRALRSLVSFAKRVAKAKKLAPGAYRCLLTPAMAGLLAHESFGHGMEADTIYKERAKAAEYFGKRLAPRIVSIADGPLPETHGFFFFDHEGWPATKTFMIKNGVVTSPITDAYNAAKLRVPRTSNGRCESFDRKIYARMSTTYFEPGTKSKAELLTQLGDGLILHESSGGMEDPKGWGIQIQGVIAEEVKKGKPTGQLFYEVGMTGYLPDVLKHIEGVSKAFNIPGTGRCGKGHHDWVRVAEGGPWLLITEVQLS